MQVPAGMLIVGFDAMEATAVDAGIERGQLPTFASLAATGSAFRLANAMTTLPGAIWPMLSTGRSAESLGLFHHPGQVHSGEAVPRMVEPSEIDPAWDWWHVAGAAGRRALVLDVPQTVPRAGAGGLQICDWRTHDGTWPTTSEPPDALRELGNDAHPADGCDDRVRRRDAGAYLDLLDHLLTSVERKTRLTESLTAREEWDVVHVVYGESHCAGHHFWGLQDPLARPYVHVAPAELRSAVTSVYGALDAALGRLVAAAGPDAHVVVVTSHGMGKYVGGYQLLPEVLARLGLRRGDGPMRSGLRRRTPWRVRALARRVVPRGPRERVLATLGERPECDLRDPATRATAVPNNRCGAIRLNLRGREPFGQVDPGADAEAVIDRLRAELLALCDPRTGDPIVTSVDRPADSGRPHLHPDLPDLTVAFREDLGPLEACVSPGVGLVEAPLWPPTGRADWPLGLGRTGDHTAESRIWIRAAGFAPAVADTGSVLDVAPTALTLLGVPAPAAMEGRPLVTPGAVTD